MKIKDFSSVDKINSDKKEKRNKRAISPFFFKDLTFHFTLIYKTTVITNEGKNKK